VNLIIDIGNTHTKAAGFDGGKMVEHIRLENHDIEGILGWMGKYRFTGAIYCDVGKVHPGLPVAVGKCCRDVIRLDHMTPLPFEVRYKSLERLGHDRIAAAAGAFDSFPGKNTVVFDFGTAITIDFISAKGAFMGGNISPGMNIRFRSLHDHTAGLPLVEKDADFPSFGDDSRSAIVAGVQRGIVHEIMGYVTAFLERHAPCEFVATGGDAAFFASFIPHPLTVDPLLVLKGLHAILDFNSRDAGK
jgi:type III pantothenate kinase